METVERLLTVAGSALVAGHQLEVPSLAAPYPDLITFLEQRNGWLAFDNALYVRPLSATVPEPGILDLAAWNDPGLWRHSFGDLEPAGVCFAEDGFGGQFVRGPEGVSFFDPETGEHQSLARDINGFAKVVLADWRFLTGYETVCAWQRLHGPLPIGSRLVPIVPMVLGGTCELENLRVLEAAEGMRTRAAVAVQMRAEPQDG